MGSSEENLALLKQIQPIVNGTGDVIKGIGGLLTVLSALVALTAA